MLKFILFAVLLSSCGRHLRQGNAGENGLNGSPGLNAIVEMAPAASGLCVNGGSTILSATDVNNNGLVDLGVDSNIRSATICNGTNAPATPYTPTAIVNPCGQQGSYDEVFLRLANGTLLASFSDNANGQNTRFAIIAAGTYTTTDGTHCSFSVDSSGNLYNEHN